MFKNEQVREIHATRYIMSWVRMGGKLSRNGEGVDEFRDWLTSIGLSESEVSTITFLASNGKMELESSARLYLKNISK